MEGVTKALDKAMASMDLEKVLHFCFCCYKNLRQLSGNCQNPSVNKDLV